MFCYLFLLLVLLLLVVVGVIVAAALVSVYETNEKFDWQRSIADIFPISS